MPSKIKVQAKEVADAIAKGLKELGLRRDQVEVTVLETPKKGFLGIGSRPAVVELRQKRWTSANLDAQIYMDVPKRKSKPSRGGRNGRKDRSEARGGRRCGRRQERAASYEVREKAPKANEPQMLPCDAIRNAVIPEHLNAPMQEAKEYLDKVLTHMGVKTENLNVWWDEKQQRILLTFDCDHPAIVIGKEGKTLEAIQYLCTLALSRHFDKPISVITDTQNYWRKAEDKIDAEIEKGIDMIKHGHSVFRFRPMSAQLRRYIHRAVEGNEFVSTASEGEGKWRKVTFRPTAKATEAFNANKAPADFVPGVIGEDIPETAPEQTPAQEAVAQAEAEKEMQAYHESCSCCGGESACESCGAAEAAPVQEQPLPTVSDDAQGATCQVEIARNCAEGETQVGCACEKNFEEPKPAEQAAPVAEVVAPAQETPAPEAAAQTPAETVADDAQDGTCQAEIARNCAEGEEQTGCACGPLFETPVQTEENK
ncbi:MAG: Jag N-terminal domain-containing protein [Elusimicrobiaceae bacterium]|nr:Jag N-terminal domain-containing protein [Elusimicrobiaceae bacterium]